MLCKVQKVAVKSRKWKLNSFAKTCCSAWMTNNGPSVFEFGPLSTVCVPGLYWSPCVLMKTTVVSALKFTDREIKEEEMLCRRSPRLGLQAHCWTIGRVFDERCSLFGQNWHDTAVFIRQGATACALWDLKKTEFNCKVKLLNISRVSRFYYDYIGQKQKSQMEGFLNWYFI